MFIYRTCALHPAGLRYILWVKFVLFAINKDVFPLISFCSFLLWTFQRVSLHQTDGGELFTHCHLLSPDPGGVPPIHTWISEASESYRTLQFTTGSANVCTSVYKRLVVVKKCSSVFCLHGFLISFEQVELPLSPGHWRLWHTQDVTHTFWLMAFSETGTEKIVTWARMKRLEDALNLFIYLFISKLRIRFISQDIFTEKTCRVVLLEVNMNFRGVKLERQKNY